MTQKKFYHRFLGDKAFYKTLMAIALPIMLQNGLTNLVSLLDNIMVGAVGTEQMSGVSIVNQLLCVFNLCVFGGLSGAGIYTAQFYGKKDTQGVQYTFRFKLMLIASPCCIRQLLMIFPITVCTEASWISASRTKY